MAEAGNIEAAKSYKYKYKYKYNLFTVRYTGGGCPVSRAGGSW